MKKIITSMLVLSLLTSGSVYAQNKEKFYGGQQGNFTMSFNAEPVLNYAGNLLNGTSDNEFNAKDFTENLSGKYFITDQIALSAGLTLNNNKSKLFNYTSKEIEKVTDNTITKKRNWTLCIGAQYYPLSGKRLQPFAGAGLIVGKENNIRLNKNLTDVNKDSKTATPSNTIGIIFNAGIEFFIWQNVSLSTCMDFGAYAITKKEVVKDDISKLDYSRKTSTESFLSNNLMTGNLALNFYF